MKLSKETAKEYIRANEVFHEVGEKVEDRITEVLRLICEFFDAKLDTWWFPDAQEGEVGTLKADLTDEDDRIPFIWEGKGLSKVDDVLVSYGGLPVKFLFMENDDILKFIEKGIKTEEERKRKNCEAAQKRKQRRKQAKKSALSKLTMDERKALGLK